jgi:uncharacterized protein (TIGR02996 family)
MPDHATGQQLRTALTADPSDAVPRAIYADWLEELGDAAAAKRHRKIAGMPPLLRGMAGRAERLMHTTARPAVLKLTVAAALTLLDPSMREPRLERGQLQAE